MNWSKQKKQDLFEQPEFVYPAALAYLARRDYGIEELRGKLAERGADEDVLEECIARLCQQKYLDDRRFAIGRVRQRREFNGKSRAFVRQELRDLGISEEWIQESLAVEYSPAQERELLERLLRSELRRFPLDGDKLQRQKALASIQRRLASRGFPPGEAYQLLRTLLRELEENQPSS